MNIPLDETLLRAETLFHQFQRMVAAVDRKRLGNSNENSQDSNEGIRRRKGKEIETNDSNDGGEGSSSNATTMRLPAISDLLRELLNKEPSQS
jgi:hypothetical protein